MTAKLTMELVNKTHPGFQEIIKDLDRIQTEGKDTTQVVGKFNQELLESTNISAKLKREQDALNDQLGMTHQAVIRQSRELRTLDQAAYGAAQQAGKLADFHRDLQDALDDRKLRKYRQEINGLADAMSGQGKPKKSFLSGFMDGLDAFKGSAVSANAYLELMKKGVEAVMFVARKAGESIAFFAEAGIPEFARLQKSGEKFREELLRIGKDKSIRAWAEETREMVEGVAIPAFSKFVDFSIRGLKSTKAMIDDGSIAMARMAEAMGLVEKGHGDRIAMGRNFINMDAEIRKRAMTPADLKREAQEEARKKEDLANLIDPGAKWKEEQRKQEELDNLIGRKDEERLKKDIRDLREEQRKLVDEIKHDAADPAQDRRVLQNQKDLLAMEQRLHSLRMENREREREEEAKKWREEQKHIQDAMLLEKQYAELRIESEWRVMEAKDRAKAKANEQLQKEVDSLKDFMNHMGGGQAAGGFGGFGGGMPMGGFVPGGMPMDGFMPGGGFNPMMGGQMPMGPMFGQGGMFPGMGGGMGMGGGFPMQLPQGINGWKPGGPGQMLGAFGGPVGMMQSTKSMRELWKELIKDAGQAAVDKLNEWGRANGILDQNNKPLTERQLTELKKQNGPDLGNGFIAPHEDGPRLMDKQGNPAVFKRKRKVWNAKENKWETEEEELPVEAAGAGPAEGADGMRGNPQPRDPQDIKNDELQRIDELKDQAMANEKWARKQRSVRQQAEADKKKDLLQGNVSNEEIAKGLNDLLDGVNQNVINRGGLDNVNIRFMQQVVEAFKQQREQDAKNMDRMNELFRQLQFVLGMGPNANRRAQAVGNGGQ